MKTSNLVKAIDLASQTNDFETNDTTVNRSLMLKEYYSRYLSEIRGVSQSSVKHYQDALKHISRRMKEKGWINEDIYEIMDLEYLNHLRDLLYQDPDFVALNKRGNQMYSVGLNHYCSFASGTDLQNKKEQIKKLDIPFEPEEPIVIPQTVYRRSNILRTQALNIADYSCEIDQSHKSFIAENNNKPYMEGHHAIPMKLQKQFDHSLDVYANIICLCPICHRKIHYGLLEERKKMMQIIYYDRADRLANSGIKLSSEEFTSIVVGN